MANQEHLDILEQGVDAWNRWRQKNPTILPDLNGADFRRASLIRANLRGANLREANFSETNLSEAILIGADLRRIKFNETNLMWAYLCEANLSQATLVGSALANADLEHANLFGADLSETDLSLASLIMADLTQANLRQASLVGADLTRAILTRADFTETNLSQAYVNLTVFGDIDLSKAKGLETIDHRGPSTIGIETFYRSKGKIPEAFLRKTGIPETFITYIHTLANQPVSYSTCFISYSSKDQIFVTQLYADLQSHNVRCWFAPEDLKIGDHYHQRIDESIRLYDKLVLILSEHALQSSWVEREVVAAREKEDQLGHEVLFPLRLDDAVMLTTKAWAADVRRRWHIGDFTLWKNHDAYQQAFERLLHDLKAER
jgi:uncharacterized protein YjbI with pentapeptide repeats